MVLICKCYGIFGLCEYKICWKVLVLFGVVGNYFCDKYFIGDFVMFNQSSIEFMVVKGKFLIKFLCDDFVFLEEFLDYCICNFKIGLLGIVGRNCEMIILGNGNCVFLCCECEYKMV